MEAGVSSTYTHCGRESRMITMNEQAVYFFVFDDLVDYEASYALAAVNNPQFQRAPGKYRIQTLGLSADPVTTLGGVRIIPDVSLAEADVRKAAMLILPGGSKWEQGGNTEAMSLARSLLEAGKSVAAICGATLGLANAGFLNDRKHTSNAPEYLAPSGYRGAAGYVDTDSVTDSRVITAGAVFPEAFAREIAKALDLYTDVVHHAWYQLIRTGDRKYFFELMSETQRPSR